ncbi:Slowpoke binding protein [Operophtera brumata]|uniref:Slowpoke binding protein n=1 Tax=Operophtera brumata TaxID=104452 RepID=A0A0L7LD07_OPEBR|nr:Slowpoke binding protein [Operophtera brumata]
MFNLYQHMKAAGGEGNEPSKEAETTGHDRFCQDRPRSSYRKKKRRGACRRAQSAAELNPESIAAANKRNAFRIRSVSTDREESEEESSEKAPLVAQKIDSLAKLLFNKSIIGTRSGNCSPSEQPNSPRYDMISQLGAIGSRTDKHWFAIHDNSIKTDRLLTLIPLTNKCPIEQGDRSQGLILELFRALHHPYIYPVLDLELRNGHALTVLPFNSRGSLKDLIYKQIKTYHFQSTWNEEFSRKYSSSGTGLPASQVARFGRQMLEGLMFLKEKGFPPFRAAPLCAVALAAQLESVEVLSLGHVAEIIEQIYGPRTPSLHELVLCELFRKIDLHKKPPPPKMIPAYMNFILGGSSGMLATSVVQPADLLKTRMQLLGPAGKNMSTIRVAKEIIQKEGPLGLYTGISAALFRQATYTTGRLGVFNVLSDNYKSQDRHRRDRRRGRRVRGDAGRGHAHPYDRRRTATAREKEKLQTRLQCFGQDHEGRGHNDAVAGSGGHHHEGHGASMISGFITSVASLPVDIVKTRVQNAAKGTGQLTVLMGVIKNEGVLALWNGFIPTYFKIGPHTVLTFIFLEQLNTLYLSL